MHECLYVCICNTYVPGASGGQKKVLNLLEVALQVVVNCHGGDGNRTTVIWKSS